MFIDREYFAIKHHLVASLIALAALPTIALAQVEPAKMPEPTRMVVEIYRIAPGMHAAFLEEIAKYDEVNKAAGLPPRQLFIHGEGASWDFMLLQPAATPRDKVAALDAAWARAKLPSGADFFINFRRFIAEHEDTFVSGPTTAAAYLASRKAK